MRALHFIYEHIGVVTGVAAALLVCTLILLLIRQILSSDESAQGASHRGAPGDSHIDLSSIEDAMKRVFATQPVSVANVGTSDSSSSSAGASRDAGSAELMAALQEREKRIEQLGKDLAKTKAELQAAATAGASSSGEAEADAGQVAELSQKIEELQARLAEYEIIEDDIADLSLFKDENAQLKKEIEELKAQLASGGSAQAPAAAAPAPSKIKVGNEMSLKFEPTSKFELDPSDDIMKQLAAAVDIQPPVVSPAAAPVAAPMTQDTIDAMLNGGSSESKPAPVVNTQADIDAMFAQAATPKTEDPQAAIDALLNQAQDAPVPAPAAQNQDAIDAMFNSASEDSPLDGSLDTDKMLSEVESLGVGEQDSAEDALEAMLDTDKLLSEVDSLQAAKPASAAAEPEDDLLAEFKDMKKSGT